MPAAMRARPAREAPVAMPPLAPELRLEEDPDGDVVAAGGAVVEDAVLVGGGEVDDIAEVVELDAIEEDDEV